MPPPSVYVPIDRLQVQALNELSLHASSIRDLCNEAEEAITQLIMIINREGKQEFAWDEALLTRGKHVLTVLMGAREPTLVAVAEVEAVIEEVKDSYKCAKFTYVFKAEIASIVANNNGVHIRQ